MTNSVSQTAQAFLSNPMSDSVSWFTLLGESQTGVRAHSAWPVKMNGVKRRRLKALAVQPFVAVSRHAGYPGFASGPQWSAVADLCHHDDVKRAFTTHRPGAAMHSAPLANPGESTAEPANCYDNNIGGLAKLLPACAAFDCRHFVS